MHPVETPEPLRPAAPAPVPPPAPPPAVVLPPPPPAVDPRPTRMQLQLLGGMFGLGALLALVGGVGSFPYDIHVELGGMFLATYATLVALSWLPPSVFTRRIDKVLDRWVRNSTTGYYGVMALAAFLSLEIGAFVDGVLAFEFDLRAIILHRLMRFSVDSMINLGFAFGWPSLVTKNGQAMGAAVLVAVTWSLFHASARVLPHATFRKPKEKKEKKKKKKRARGD
jgi:hypothetical protein